MENLDLLVLRQLHGWRKAGTRAVLATVTRTWGSSPRPVGSIMALREDGAVVGSVSGGCIEDDLIRRFVGAMPDGPPQSVRYGVSADEAHRFGLPCGGTLELMLEFNPDPQSLASLLHALDDGLMVARQVRLADGCVTLQRDVPSNALTLNSQVLVNHFGPAYRMLLIGAGQLSEYLATMAVFNGFAVTVVDPREEYRGAWSVPQANVLTGMPDDVVKDMRPDHRTAIIALTHDPKLDDLALLAALDTDAFYVGAIGSRRNQQARRSRLGEHFDVSAENLERLRGPIGLHIGSKTPAEIAVSVMAEVIACKNEVTLPKSARADSAKLDLATHPSRATG
jgi:xanthine dehydrogenase accessory factor